MQGLPGPPGEKGENGDVGAMVSVSIFSLAVFHIFSRTIQTSLIVVKISLQDWKLH